MKKNSNEYAYNLGLLYIYLFNNKTQEQILLEKLEKFKQAIEKNLQEQNYPISSNDSIDNKFREKIYFSFINEEGKECYALKKDFNLTMAKSFYIDRLPLNIILASQMPNALDCLGLIWINDEIQSIDKLKAQKKENECCQKCEYAISDELLDCIIEENSKYQNIPYDNVREQIGYCEIYSTGDVATKLGFWCPNYLSKEEMDNDNKNEKNRVLKK